MPRRPDATGRRFAVVLIAGCLEPTSTAYIRAPELNQVLDQPPVILLELPWPAFEEGKAFFPESGQFGRRQAPVDSVATRASPSPISPPRTLPPSRVGNPSINFGRRPPQPKDHFVPEASSAAELAAGDLLHLRRPYDHWENRPSHADPSLPSDAREELPNTGEDRRSPRLCSARGRGGSATGQT